MGPAPAGLEAHLAGCPECRAQWSAHRELLGLTDGAPRLSESFNARLMGRLEREATAAESRRRAWPWIVLRLYWALAALASLAVLSQIDWTRWIAALSPGERVGIALAVLALPMIALFDLPWPRRSTETHA